jgi:hypothetical protein
VEVLRQGIVRGNPPSPRRLAPALDRGLEAVVLKCLEKAPGRRYASAAELADDLRRWLDGEPVRARPPRWPGRLTRRLLRSSGVRWAAGLAASAAVAAALVAGLFLRNSAPKPPSEAENVRLSNELAAARLEVARLQHQLDPAVRQHDEAIARLTRLRALLTDCRDAPSGVIWLCQQTELQGDVSRLDKLLLLLTEPTDHADPDSGTLKEVTSVVGELRCKSWQHFHSEAEPDPRLFDVLQFLTRVEDQVQQLSPDAGGRPAGCDS